MKRFPKILFAAAAVLLLLPTFAFSLDLPKHDEVTFSNSAEVIAAGGNAEAVFLSVDIDQVGTVEIAGEDFLLLHYMYCVDNLGWQAVDDSGTLSDVGVSGVEVPFGAYLYGAAWGQAVPEMNVTPGDGVFELAENPITGWPTIWTTDPFSVLFDIWELQADLDGGVELFPGDDPIYFSLLSANSPGTTDTEATRVFDSIAELQTVELDASILSATSANLVNGVPEPGTLLLLGSGILGLAVLYRRKNNLV